MTNESTHRGSVIIMVVGLLALMSMLGATFLIICRLDAQQAQKIAVRRQANPTVDGLVSQIVNILKEDLYLDNGTPTDASDDRPYSSIDAGPAGPAGWKKFIDYASDTEGLDAHLWYDDGTTQHWSNVSGTSVDVEDTDGDGVADAYLSDTGVMNSEGDRIWAAVRVVDLSSLMCVNTAVQDGGTGITMPDTTYPVSISLREFLKIGESDYSLYTALHNERCGGTGTDDLSDFWSKSAQKLLRAESPYLPFAISDE
ncbi:MAG: hypothetical protein KAU28_03305, partial [Phycisphaerae bacterium]|nr:hypothetical protein [Phycisphaerae bacterium]